MRFGRPIGDANEQTSQFDGVRGLHQVPVETGRESTLQVRLLAVPRDRDQSRVRRVRVASQRSGHLEPVHPGKADVAHYDVRRVSAGCLDSHRAGRSEFRLMAERLEECLECLGRVAVIFDDQDAKAGCRFGASRERGSFIGLRRQERQRHRECAPVPQAGARGFNPSLMQFHQSFYDREPEPQPAARPIQGSIGLAERLKDEGEHLRLDADSGIADAEDDVPLLAVRGHGKGNGSAAIGELPGVPQQVVDHLRESRGIPVCPQGRVGNVHYQGEFRVGERGAVIAGRGSDEFRNVDVAALQRDSPARDPGQVEQIADQVREVVHLSNDDATGLGDHVAVLTLQPQQFGRVANGRERIPKLVR